MKLTFGETDGDTEAMMFAVIANGYIIEVNGVDYVGDSVDSSGLFVRAYDEDTGEATGEETTLFTWGEIDKIHIY